MKRRPMIGLGRWINWPYDIASCFISIPSFSQFRLQLVRALLVNAPCARSDRYPKPRPNLIHFVFSMNLCAGKSRRASVCVGVSMIARTLSQQQLKQCLGLYRSHFSMCRRPSSQGANVRAVAALLQSQRRPMLRTSICPNCWVALAMRYIPVQIPMVLHLTTLESR